MAESVAIFKRRVPVAFALMPTVLLITIFVLPIGTWLLSAFAQKAALIEPHAVFRGTFSRTAALAALSSLVALFAGGAVAFLSAFSQPRAQRWLTAMMLLPLLIGYLARNYAWLGMLTSLSNAPTWLGIDRIGNLLLNTRAGVIIVTATVFIPISFFLLLQGFTSIRPEAIRSAESLGCSRNRCMAAVVLPHIVRQALTAWGLCFVQALSYFVTPRMIGSGRFNFVGNEIMRILKDPGDIAAASWIALDLLCATTIPIALIVYYSYRRRRLLMGE